MFGSTKKKGARPEDELLEEIRRVEASIEASLAEMYDPEVGLPQRMRLNLRRIQLEAYAAGLRYAIGDRDGSFFGELESRAAGVE